MNFSLEQNVDILSAYHVERFTGYAEITIEAETEQEAIDLYNEGSYDDDVYIKDDMYYDFQFDSIKEAT